MQLDIKQMKLISGEEIIAEVIDSVVDDESMPFDALVMKNPFTVDVFRKNVYLRPYMILAKQDQVHLLNMDHLSVIMDPNRVLQALYRKTMDDFYEMHPEAIPDEHDVGIFRDEDFMADSSEGNIIRFDRFDPNKMH